MSVQNLTFDSHNLQTTASAAATILTKDIIYNNLPTKEINLKSDSIRDGFSILDVKYSEKIITVSGWLISDTAANFYTLINNFKNYLRPKEKPLNIETYGGSGTYISWVATTRDISIPEEFHAITQKPFEVSFLCEPFGKATSATSQSWNNKTASLSNEPITVTGTYKSLPTITIHIDSETDMTAIKFNNDTNLDWIQIVRSFAAGEDLIIDCENETVKVDGTSVDFTGIFPRLDSGSNSFDLTITDSGAFQYDLTISYYPRYL